MRTHLAGVGDYFAEVWRCRYFWMSLVKMDLRTRYRRSILGMGWSLLHPIAMTTVLCVVFAKVFKVEIQEFAPFVLAGLATWNFILTSTQVGCQSLYQGEMYIRQQPAPLAIYPLRTTLGGVVHYLMALLVVLACAAYFKGLANPVVLLSLVPTVVLLFALAWSLATLAGFANVYFNDTQHLCEVFFQILFYATPVMIFPRFLNEMGLNWLLLVNPLVPFLELVRTPILEGRVPPWTTYAAALFVVGVAGSGAALTLARLQKRLIFHL
jgi:lipopolysaccharide transport system permease protein